MTQGNFYIKLGDLPPIAWMLIVGIALMIVGKLVELNFLFWLGVIILIIVGVGLIIGMLQDLFN